MAHNLPSIPLMPCTRTVCLPPYVTSVFRRVTALVHSLAGRYTTSDALISGALSHNQARDRTECVWEALAVDCLADASLATDWRHFAVVGSCDRSDTSGETIFHPYGEMFESYIRPETRNLEQWA